MTEQLELFIEKRRPFADGMIFGDSGAYERLDARAYFKISPQAGGKAGTVDIDRAVTNSEGLVEFCSDVCILKPVDHQAGNRRLFFGYGNRGNKRELQFFNDAVGSNDPLTTAHAGNGFLMRRGYTIVWAAWEGDLLPGNGRMLLDVPIAGSDSDPITGIQRTEFIIDEPGRSWFPLSGQTAAFSYPTVSMDTTKASLSRRRYTDNERQILPSDAWAFARVEAGEGRDGQGGEQAVLASDCHIYLRGGFETGWIYELVYTAIEPRVMGLGHLVVRNLISHLRYEQVDANGHEHGLGPIDKAYAWGRSQTGRCIRDFVHQGFNTDARGRRVFDGVMPHVSGAGLMWMNHRFANVISMAGQEHEEHDSPADRFPFCYGTSVNHLTGVEDAILKRPSTDPLVLHTQTASEYWQRRGSLVHTDSEGNDVEPPDNARVYLWSSSQHFADPLRSQPSRGITENFENIVWTSMLFRAMLDALDAWATDGTLPPDSRIPRRGDGTLVDAADWRTGFPDIPGVKLPRGPNRCPHMDFGETQPGVLTRQPPLLDGEYPTLVPAVDADGNDIAGVRVPMVVAPLGTYTGWNIRTRGYGHGAMHEFTGSYIPFCDTPEECRATGDPRPSVLERYPTAQHYTDAIECAARELVEQRLMIEEDVVRVVAASENYGRPLHDIRL